MQPLATCGELNLNSYSLRLGEMNTSVPRGFQLITFQAYNSDIWLLAAILDRAGIGQFPSSQNVLLDRTELEISSEYTY